MVKFQIVYFVDKMTILIEIFLIIVNVKRVSTNHLKTTPNVYRVILNVQNVLIKVQTVQIVNFRLKETFQISVNVLKVFTRKIHQNVENVILIVRPVLRQPLIVLLV
jgi:hypothetical protein